jgi:hypothetical protein
VALLSKVNSNFQNVSDELDLKEDETNKVTSIDYLSTDSQYTSAKLVYDEL